jgi:hypothetical protein
MSNAFPHELAMGDVYYSPMLAVAGLSLVITWITVIVLNKLRWSRFLSYPSATFMAIMVFYVVAIDHWFIKI